MGKAIGGKSMWYQKEICELLKVKYPIIQAPMAGGVTTPELVAEVSNNGGLGMIGAGYMSSQQLREAISKVKAKTNMPFGVNLFVPERITISTEEVRKAAELLQSFKDDLKIKDDGIPVSFAQSYEEQLEVVLAEDVPVCSFTFGIPDDATVKNLKDRGKILIGSATTVEEAITNEKVSMDAVVVQGSEAGGHRGSFLDADSPLIGTMALVPQAVDAVKIPVIAAGGIMDGRGIIAALSLGAASVQMGTAFLTCQESGAHPLHKEAILSSSETLPEITRSFSGKSARGLRNSFMEQMKPRESEIPPYPVQNALTKTLRKAAGEQNRTEYMSLWSGQGTRLSKNLTVKQFMEELIRSASETVERLGR